MNRPIAMAPDNTAASLALSFLQLKPKKRSKTEQDILFQRWVSSTAARPKIAYVDEMDIIQAIKTGFSGNAIDRVNNTLALPQSWLAMILGITEKTMRSMRHRKALDKSSSDALFRIMKAYSAAYLLFGNPWHATAWLKEPSEAMGGATPIDLLDTSEGEALVHYELNSMRYGLPV